MKTLASRLALAVLCFVLIAACLKALAPTLAQAALYVLVVCGEDPFPKTAEYTTRFDNPLTYTQAINEKKIWFPFPEAAKNISYACYGESHAFAMIARFDAPIEDCIKHIDTVMAWNNKMNRRDDGRNGAYPRVSVTSVEPVDVGYLEPTGWFSPATITHGIHVGEIGGHHPQIWVDLDKGTFYYMEED